MIAFDSSDSGDDRNVKRDVNRRLSRVGLTPRCVLSSFSFPSFRLCLRHIASAHPSHPPVQPVVLQRASCLHDHHPPFRPRRSSNRSTAPFPRCARPVKRKPAGAIEPKRASGTESDGFKRFLRRPRFRFGISCGSVYVITLALMEPGTPTMSGSVNSVSSTPSANPPRSRFASESPISLLVNSLKDRLLFAVPKKGELQFRLSRDERSEERSDDGENQSAAGKGSSRPS